MDQEPKVSGDLKNSDSAELENLTNSRLGSETSELGNSGAQGECESETKYYTFEQLKEVYYLGMINGATVLQLCQDNTSDVLSSFEKVTNEIKNVVTSEQSIRDLAGSTGMLLGVSAEILGLETIV